MSDEFYIQGMNEDGENYISLFDIDTVIEDALAKVLYVDFATYGFKYLLTDPENPMDLSTLTEIGNWRIDDFIDGPDNLAMVQPISVCITTHEGNLFQMVMNMLDIYCRYAPLNEDGTIGEFSEWKVSLNYKGVLYCGDVEPTNPGGGDIWIDITTPDYPLLKLYNLEDGWVGVGSMVDVLNAMVYDETGRKEDIFLYFERVLGFPSANPDSNDYVNFYNLRAKFLRHMVDLGHITPAERALFDSLVSIPEVNQRVLDATKIILDYLAEKIAALGLEVLHTHYETSYTAYHNHYDKFHPSQETRDYWDAKSEVDHEHNLDNHVFLSTEDIVSGVISRDRMPKEALHILKRVLTHEERFALTKDDVQNGDSVYVIEETDDYESGLYLVYDDDKLNMDGGYVYYRTRRIANIDYEDIIRKATTLEGYGIEDGSLVHKDPVDYSFLYPYETIDNSVNYALTQALNTMNAEITEILDNIEEIMNRQDVSGIESLVYTNLENYIDINTRWVPYRLINERHIPVQHEVNVALYEETEVLYAASKTAFLGDE